MLPRVWWPVLISGFVVGRAPTPPSRARIRTVFPPVCRACCWLHLHESRISLRIHHKAASRYGLPTYSPQAQGLQPRRFMLSVFEVVPY